MLRPIVVTGAAGILVASALGLSVPDSILKPRGFSILHTPPEVDEKFESAFRSDFLSDANLARSGFSLSSLSSDPQIEHFINYYLSDAALPESIELNEVFDELQVRFPGAQYLAANLVSAPSREELMRQLTTWDELIHPEFHNASTAVTKEGRRLYAMSVLSRRIPKFTLEAANHGGGRFFNVCPHEGSVHALDLDRKSKTLILSCPDCGRPYDVLASDSQGQMRRANQFFTEFKLPSSQLDKAYPSKKDCVMAIWQAVAERCSYEHDHSKFAESEVWKTSDETWSEMQGDCEDTSILLVDTLISAGFEARVAIGWNGNIGQHAWAAVNLGGEQYVIESTIQDSPTAADLIPVKDAAPFYRPEQLFDRDRLYFQSGEPEQSSFDYFCESAWTAVSRDS